MDISDLLKIIPGLNGAPDGLGVDPAKLAANPVPGPAPTSAGVGDFLGTPPGAMQGQASDSAPPPQAPPAPMADESSLGMPITPPSDDAGLHGFLSRMVDKATHRNDDTGLSLIDRIGQFGGAITDMEGSTKGAEKSYSDLGAGRVAASAEEEQRQKIGALADQLGMSPREKLLFLSNPKEWAAANKDRLGFHQITGGDVGQYGEPGAAGSVTSQAPKVGVQNGEGYSVDSAGLKDTGGLAVSPEQEAQNALKDSIAKATEDYHRALIGLGAQRNNISQQRVNKPAMGNGGDWRSKVVGRGSVQ